jgi:hypothetical protein
MKLTVDDINENVTNTEADREGYRALATEWEKLWRMDVYKRTWKQAMEEGQEQITLPTTYNTVGLAQRLFASEPKIEVPPCHPTKDKDDDANLRERWLKAMWMTVDYQQRRSIISDLVWQSLVRGRHAIEVKWVKDELPAKMKDKRFPILIRTLDPMNIGVREGPLWTEYAYHKYTQRISQIIQRYPNLKRFESYKQRTNKRGSEEELTVIDFWWTGKEGDVWNAVVVDDEFVKKPVATSYPFIPIIEGYGDSAPLPGETYKGLSILHPIKDLYPYQCRMASQLATGLMYYFWPMMTAMSEDGREIPDFNVRPGQIIYLSPGTQLNQIQPSPNVPLAQAMQGTVDGAMQQATFPGVLYGQAPGELQAGYGVSLLSDAAKGRVNQTRFNLEKTLELVNMLVLGLVEEFGGDDGVVVWGKNERAGDMYSVALTPDDISGYYENRVTITPVLPADIVQRQTLAIRLNETGIISKRTVRDKYLDIPLPEDEAVRVEIEQALMDEAMRPKVILDMLRSYYPDDWETMIAGTPYEQAAQAEKAKESGAPPPMGGMPPGMPPDMMGMPPMPPDMGGMGPMGPGPIQPPSMNMDAGTFPPELSGQMTPELMGLPPDMPPEMFAQLMGNPLPPGEELAALGGI